MAKKLKRLRLGVIELHPNEALRNDFYKTVKADEGYIVDVMVMDIAACLRRHGYHMLVLKLPPEAMLKAKDLI